MTRSLRARILSAGLWTAGGFAIQRIFQLLSNLILTRLLFPEAFGLMALANVFMIALAMLSDVGIRPAIVQNPRGEDPVFLQTAWTLQVIRGFMLWLGACALAYPAARIYHQPILWPLISMLGGTAAISGFSSISAALCERKLLVQRLTIFSTVGQVTSLLVTIALTWQFKSIWALVAGNIAGSTITMVFSHVLLPRQEHKFRWDKEASTALVRFGRWIFLSTAMTFMAGQGLRMLQGLLLTPAEFGVLAVAQTISLIPGELTQQIARLAVFPALAEARNVSQDKMAVAMRNLHGKLMALSTVLHVCLIFCAKPVITLLYDYRYHEAGVELGILAVGGAVAALSQTYQSAVLAMGETRLNAAFNAVGVIARISLMLLGYKIGGAQGMLWGICAGSLASFAFVASKARKRGILFIGIDGFCLAGIAASYFAADTFGLT